MKWKYHLDLWLHIVSIDSSQPTVFCCLILMPWLNIIIIIVIVRWKWITIAAWQSKGNCFIFIIRLMQRCKMDFLETNGFLWFEITVFQTILNNHFSFPYQNICWWLRERVTIEILVVWCCHCEHFNSAKFWNVGLVVIWNCSLHFRLNWWFNPMTVKI